MQLIVDFVPTTKMQLIGCFKILEEKYDDILDEYGNRLLGEIHQFLIEENLMRDSIAVQQHYKRQLHPTSSQKLLSSYQQQKLVDTIKNLANSWAKEEQGRGNPIIGTFLCLGSLPIVSCHHSNISHLLETLWT